MYPYLSLQLSSSKAAVFGVRPAADVKIVSSKKQVKAVSPVAMAGAPSFVPDMSRRNIMNALLAGAVALPGSAVLGGWLFVLVPPRYVCVLLRYHGPPRHNSTVMGISISSFLSSLSHPFPAPPPPLLHSSPLPSLLRCFSMSQAPSDFALNT